MSTAGPKYNSDGDDDSSSQPIEQKKKPVLNKFGLSPDVNYRDIFWQILDSYIKNGVSGIDLTSLDEATMTRIVSSIISSQNLKSYGHSEEDISSGIIKMFIDAKWEEGLLAILEGSYSRIRTAKLISSGLKKAANDSKYFEVIKEFMIQLIRGKINVSAALEYLSFIENPQIIISLKKELLILAKGDIGQNQINAIKALAFLKEDETKKTFLMLLSHWDVDARLAAAEALIPIKDDPEVKTAVSRKLSSETDNGVKKILNRLI